MTSRLANFYGHIERKNLEEFTGIFKNKIETFLTAGTASAEKVPDAAAKLISKVLDVVASLERDLGGAHVDHEDDADHMDVDINNT